METPIYDHISAEEFLNVYEPAEDTFLLLDAIEADLQFLHTRLKPTICLEIGSGSGVISTAVAKQFKDSVCLSTDINPIACSVTKRTGQRNHTIVDPIQMHLVDGLRAAAIDLLIFNPPYVVTSDEELTSAKLEAGNTTTKNLIHSWAGGTDGRRVIDILINNLPGILSPTGVLYLLLLKENKPDEVIARLRESGFVGLKFMERRIPGEYLYILKIFHKDNNYE